MSVELHNLIDIYNNSNYNLIGRSDNHESSKEMIIDIITYVLSHKKKNLFIAMMKTLNENFTIKYEEIPYINFLLKVYQSGRINHTNFIDTLIQYDPLCILKLYPQLSVSHWWSIIETKIFKNYNLSRLPNNNHNNNNHNNHNNTNELIYKINDEVNENVINRIKLLYICEKKISAKEFQEEYKLSNSNLKRVLKMRKNIDKKEIIARIFYLFYGHKCLVTEKKEWLIYRGIDQGINRWQKIKKTEFTNLMKDEMVNNILTVCNVLTQITIKTAENKKMKNINFIKVLLESIDYLKEIDDILSYLYDIFVEFEQVI